jgi:hypothetical protein
MSPAEDWSPEPDFLAMSLTPVRITVIEIEFHAFDITDFCGILIYLSSNWKMQLNTKVLSTLVIIHNLRSDI